MGTETIFGRGLRVLAALGLGAIAFAPSCKSNEVTAVAASCPIGFVDCNEDPADGCEVNTTADAKNCGGCGAACNSANGVAICVESSCGIRCTTGFADCNNNPTDGCETDTNTDTTNCGGCKVACDLTNASETCTAGKCTLAKCTAPYADCDGDLANGCETDTSSAMMNCGACSATCAAVTNSTAVCADQKCTVTCDAGFTKCGEACIDTTGDANNCGACGNTCSGTACTNGECNRILAKDLYFPERVAAGNSLVFFSDKAGTTIWALPPSADKGVPTSFVSGLTSVDGLAALGNRLYYKTGTKLYVINDDGTSSKMITDVASGAWTLSNGRLYFATTSGSSSTMMTADLDGSKVFPVAAASAGSTNILGAAGCSLLSQHSATGTGSAIRSTPLGGGVTLNLATATPSGASALFSGLTADASHVFFNDTAGSTWVWKRVLSTGGTVETMGASFGFEKLLTDATSNFVLVGTTGTLPSGRPNLGLSRFPVGGKTLTSLYASAADFDLQGAYLYLADPTAGTIVRLTKGGTPGGGVSSSTTCTCATGYSGDGKVCRSCASNNGGCDANATCAATSTGVSCTCNPGYAGSGVSCVSQCTVGNGGCDTNATCSLTSTGVACAVTHQRRRGDT